MMAFAYHLSKSLETIILLKNYQNNFEIESLVIRNAKCYLLNNHCLDGFTINDEEIDCYQTNEGYNLEYDGYTFELEVNEDMITSYNVRIVEY